jgi:hypothetical protein
MFGSSKPEARLNSRRMAAAISTQSLLDGAIIQFGLMKVEEDTLRGEPS